jgi:hypothetical protein
MEQAKVAGVNDPVHRTRQLSPTTNSEHGNGGSADPRQTAMTARPELQMTPHSLSTLLPKSWAFCLDAIKHD